MSEARDGEETLSWFELGEAEELKKRKCRRLYTASGKDLALFYVDKDTFYATSAICPHAKGPLDQGDIEDLGQGRYLVTCPLHFYSFDLRSGSSSTGLKLETYEVETRDGQIFVKAPEQVSMKPIKKT